jgi:hypothetical protein
MPIVPPADADEQTRLLVEAGIAEAALRVLPLSRPGTEGLTLEQCQFWVRQPEVHGRNVKPQFQIVVSYPAGDGDAPRYDCGLVVFTPIGVWAVKPDEVLTPDQLKLVQRLAAS